MGILDIFRRKPQTVAPQKKRSYVAASSTARYGDFKSSAGSADYELTNSLAELRRKARFLARNSASMVRYMQLMRENVVGDEGFRLQMRVKRDDGTLALSLNDRVETAWRDWCESPTTDGVMTFEDLLEQMSDTWCRDGEVIWEVVYGPQWTHGIAINPIEGDYLDETLNTTNKGTGNEIRMGVEIDSNGAPVAYHFLTYHPGDIAWGGMTYAKDRHRRVPAERVIHMFRRTRPGQTRGEPPTTSIVNSVKMLDGYREAEVVGRRLKSAIMGFFTSAVPKADGIDQLADQENTERDEFEMNVTPGVLKELPPGLDFKEFNPGGGQSDYDQFEGQVKKDQSMGYGISAFSHGMETKGVSYSTGRSVLIEDRDHYRAMQKFFIRAGIVRVFRLWAGSINVQDDSPFTPTQYRKVVARRAFIFRPRGWDWVDPTKDVAANTEALRTKQTSLSRVAAQRGIDRDELLAEIAEDNQAAELYGLTLDYDDDKATPTRDGSDAEEDED